MPIVAADRGAAACETQRTTQGATSDHLVGAGLPEAKKVMS